MRTSNISWGVKAAGVDGRQTYHFHVSTLLKFRNLNLLETTGPVQACTGIALTLNLIRFKIHTSQNLGEYNLLF
jgi:hypothetical protein